jgi:hypothetical protein
MPAFDPSPEMIAALASSGGTVFVSWLIRRDRNGRTVAIETQRVAEVSRRIDVLETHRVADVEKRLHSLETQSVSQRDLENLSARLDLIHSDLRDVRLFQLGIKPVVVP